MSRHLVPSSQWTTPPAPGGIGGPPVPGSPGTPPAGLAVPTVPRWTRYRAALLRYRWLILALTLVGAAAGFALSRVVPPAYAVSARLWISDPASRADSTGPIQRGPLLPANAWGNVLTSYSVL